MRYIFVWINCGKCINSVAKNILSVFFFNILSLCFIYLCGLPQNPITQKVPVINYSHVHLVRVSKALH